MDQVGVFLTQLLESTAEVPDIWGYILVFMIAWFENIFPPIPGDVLVVFGGAVAATGALDLFLIIVFSVVGGTVGFMCMYYLGRYGGPKLLKWRSLRWIPADSVERTQNWIRSWGYWVVAANRFLSGVRTVIAFTVGMNAMPAVLVGALACLSATLWVTLIAGTGYLVGDNWEIMVEYMKLYGRGIFTVISLFLLWQLYKAAQRSRSKT